MNTYLIPVTEPFGYKYNYIACVYASTPREAYHKAKQIPDIDLYLHMVNEDPSTYIAEALLPAKVMAVDIKDEERFAQVIVPDDQLSLAIGKAGQNARLAAKLTNWKIDIKSESQFREMIQELQANGEEKEETEDAENVDETNVEEANKVENVETSEENKDEE